MSSAAVTPEAACGPVIPAKKIANATGIVTSAASQVVPLTAVPMISARLPTTASSRWAMALSRRVPPNAAKIRVANPPNVANSAICASPMTLNVSANRPGTTTVARTARMAAGTDHAGRQPEPAAARDRRARNRAGKGRATAGSDITKV